MCIGHCAVRVNIVYYRIENKNMDDNENYYTKSEDEDENCSNNIPYNKISREEDSLLVDLVKSYPHLYDKQSRDFKDIKKKNNSWEEIGKLLNASGIKYICFLY